MNRGVLLAVAVLLGALVSGSRAAPRGSTQTQTVYRDEGRNPTNFQVSCTSYSWTTVMSSDTVRRSILLEATPTNTVNVCVQAASTATLACTDTLVGSELTAGSTLTDYTQSAWICQCRTGNSCGIKGYYTRDKADFGDIGAPRLQ